ncbi:hypothetical protein BCR34DRAFT_621435 [Clohesyomyces aquaticus]|uniref:Uncharacterized protein n=1 Tax=Clohesyomyces aquaticus TaxID=1231657 RepID=A0A1Y2A7K2_9PLEO|nr:hypothetical protein BCR34DRAFT_621435 [Clohesyomyces aquaticus]
MLPALQPSRPKLPQPHPRANYPHQQNRTTHTHTHEGPLNPSSPPRKNPAPKGSPSPSKSLPLKPRNQIEAMPPLPLFAPARNPSFYDSAVRHPVFFTEQLRKPPFPIPSMASQGWNPAANGYVLEKARVAGGEARTKL